MLARRSRFFGSLLYRRVANADGLCAYCSGGNTTIVGRKFGIMQIRRCLDCGLMFRWPKDSEITNFKFYQSRYVEPRATDLPPESDLPDILSRNFAGTRQDRGDAIALLKAINPPPAKLLDFGCSWGYALHQMERAGYTATGFEISKPRAAFGRRALGVSIIDNYGDLDRLPAHSFDAIYSRHVLEHLPALTGVLERLARLLRPGGALLLFTPNCGDGTGNLREGWKPIVGEKHPMAFDTVFFRNVLPRHGFHTVTLTSPYKTEELLAGTSSHADNGHELLVYGRVSPNGR
jgi:2-polyprenyl-3-methyl-5-hydroxy-6-metoxy-1,4-benzoquinol methylase